MILLSLSTSPHWTLHWSCTDLIAYPRTNSLAGSSFDMRYFLLYHAALTAQEQIFPVSRRKAGIWPWYLRIHCLKRKKKRVILQHLSVLPWKNNQRQPKAIEKKITFCKFVSLLLLHPPKKCLKHTALARFHISSKNWLTHYPHLITKPQRIWFGALMLCGHQPVLLEDQESRKDDCPCSWLLLSFSLISGRAFVHLWPLSLLPRQRSYWQEWCN